MSCHEMYGHLRERGGLVSYSFNPRLLTALNKLLRFIQPSFTGAILVRGCCLHRFNASLHQARCLAFVTQSSVRTSHQIQTFRIRWSMLEKLVERHARVFKLARRDVRRCNFTPDLVLRVCRIAGDDVFEVLNRVGVSFLLARNASELITRVDLAVVDL